MIEIHDWRDALKASPEEREAFKARVLADTGAFAREVIGMNYDKDENGVHINVGTGGISSDGCSGEQLAAMDDGLLRQVLILSPRLSRKTSRILSFVARRMILEPDIRVLYATKTGDLLEDFCNALCEILESEAVTALWGQVRDPHSPKQTFTTLTRTNRADPHPSFRSFSFGSIAVGKHADIIVIDDFIDMHSGRTAKAQEWAHKLVRMLFPLRDMGCKTIVVGTRYGHNDMYAPLLENPQWKKVVHGAGVRVVKSQRGDLDLELEASGLTFPFLDMRYLREALRDMSHRGDFYDFSCQYLNRIPSGVGETFLRRYFKPMAWDGSMSTLTGFLLTDTATSELETGCYSALAYVGLDMSGNIFLLDADLGHWRPAEFAKRFMDMLDRWQHKVQHRGEVWEAISLTTVFQSMLEMMTRLSGVKLNTIEVKRAGAKNKLSRIEALEEPMRTGKFRVVDTMPRNFVDLDGEKLLWNPRAVRDTDEQSESYGQMLPSGELVDEFLNLRVVGQKIDLADALAMVMESTRDKKPLLKPLKPSMAALERAGLTDMAHRPYERASDEQPHGDWLDRTIRDVLG